jgi:hypothetical protein
VPAEWGCDCHDGSFHVQSSHEKEGEGQSWWTRTRVLLHPIKCITGSAIARCTAALSTNTARVNFFCEWHKFMYVQVDVTDRAIIESDDESEKCSVSIVVSIPACHVGDLGSIPRRSDRRVFSA